MFIHTEDPEFETLQKLMHERTNLHESSNQYQSSKRYTLEHLQKTIQERIPALPVEQTPEEDTLGQEPPVGGLFAPIKGNCTIQESVDFTPRTPVSYNDRRTAAATVWGTPSPHVSVWEQRLRQDRVVNSHNNNDDTIRSDFLSTPPGF